SLTLRRVALRLGSATAFAQTLREVADSKAPEARRLGLIEVLGQLGRADSVPALLQVLREAKTDPLRRTALNALQPFADKEITEPLLALYPKLSRDLRERAQAWLCGRPASALALLKAVDAGRIPAKEVAPDQVRRLAQHKDGAVSRLVEKHWGKIR